MRHHNGTQNDREQTSTPGKLEFCECISGGAGEQGRANRGRDRVEGGVQQPTTVNAVAVCKYGAKILRDMKVFGEPQSERVEQLGLVLSDGDNDVD